MSATGWKLAKYTVIVGATIGLVGCFAGTDNTITMTRTAISGTAWGVGVAGGAAKEVGPAFKAGFGASNQGSSNYQTFTPQPSPTPKAQPKKKPPAKVPNCTPKQLKAAPQSCA